MSHDHPASPHTTFIESDQHFKTHVLDKSNSVPVLAVFSASWCPPCRALKPILIEIAAEFNGKFEFAYCDCDIESLGAYASQYEVSGIPHVVLIKNGQKVAQFVGGKPKEAVVTFLSQNGINQ